MPKRISRSIIIGTSYLTTIWIVCIIQGPHVVTSLLNQHRHVSVNRISHIKTSPLKHANYRQRAMGRRRIEASPMSTSALHNLAVKLDQPLLLPIPKSRLLPYRTTSNLFKSLLTILVSDAFKTVVIAFFLALSLSLAARYTSQSSVTAGLIECFKSVRGKAQRFIDRLRPAPSKGIPMTFENEGGWGVCTLTSKKALWSSNYVEYTFELPHKENTIPLAMGQQVTVCCLDGEGNLAKAGFYPFNMRGKEGLLAKGELKIVAPKWDGNCDVVKEVGADVGHFARVLESEFKLGDELALKPGKVSLNYRGKDFPIKDMFFLVSGMGVIPVIDLIKSVLPSGSSSVRQLSLLWINPTESDFDIAFRDLEKEFFKYNTKLDVSCVLSNVLDDDWEMEGNEEIEASIQKFRKGTMAIVSGPEKFVEKGMTYLIEDRDFPEESICMLS